MTHNTSLLLRTTSSALELKKLTVTSPVQPHVHNPSCTTQCIA
jgi:hypothetical protein